MGAAVLVIQAILAALTAAPQAIEVVKQGKALIATFQKNGILTKSEQIRLDAFCDEIETASLAGDELPSWEVEPDPQ